MDRFIRRTPLLSLELERSSIEHTVADLRQVSPTAATGTPFDQGIMEGLFAGPMDQDAGFAVDRVGQSGSASIVGEGQVTFLPAPSSNGAQIDSYRD